MLFWNTLAAARLMQDLPKSLGGHSWKGDGEGVITSHLGENCHDL